MERGIIKSFGGTWGSGIGYLLVESNGKGLTIPCENAPTVRALENCFGNVIGPGHSVDNENGGHVGEEIFFSVDDFGMLEGFTPIHERLVDC